VGEAADATEAVRLAAELLPDIVLLDIHLRSESGVEVAREIGRLSPGTRVIALSMSQSDEMIAAMMQAGAQGYVLKDAGGAELVQAVRTVAAGGVAMGPDVTSRLLADYRRLAEQRDAPSVSQLSERELQILRLLASGQSNGEIGRRLSLSQQTIKNQLTVMYQKLGVTNRTEAVSYVMSRGLVRR
jgi:DNA-binding NarL/FixJ family response regulator